MIEIKKPGFVASCALFAVFFSGLMLVPAASDSAKPRNQAARWVGTWASAPQPENPHDSLPAPGFADTTLRQTLHVSLGGERIRVRFSNAFGTTPLKIDSAHVALSMEPGGIEPQTDKALSFDGEPSTSVPPGALAYSDPVDFHLPALADLGITIHLPVAPDGITTHAGSRETSYLLAGNAVSLPDMSRGAHLDHWYFLNGVDVLAADRAAAVAVLGDSITDGRNSTTNGNDRWTDDFARRLHTSPGTSNIGVLNEGIGGNRLVNDGPGPNALARLDRDVLAQSGVRWLIVLEGINDIGARVTSRVANERPATVQEITAAYDQIIVRAHAHNILVLGATILPFEGSFYYSSDGESDRQAVNDWIRTSGRFDGVIDFDAAARDPLDRARLAASVDSGDHLHPGSQGYRLLSDSINLRIFRFSDTARAQ
jgi:lysophospholipase L1-like esterase